MIEPILIYGSEAWGYENLKFIEQIHLKYCKRVLQVRNITANFVEVSNMILKIISQSNFIKYRLHAFNPFESVLILFIQGQH
jgi:hypothetical protein